MLMLPYALRWPNLLHFSTTLSSCLISYYQLISLHQVFHYFLLPKCILCWWPTLVAGWRKACLHLKSFDMQLTQYSLIISQRLDWPVFLPCCLLFLAIIFLYNCNFWLLITTCKFQNFTVQGAFMKSLHSNNRQQTKTNVFKKTVLLYTWQALITSCKVKQWWQFLLMQVCHKILKYHF